MSASDTSNAFLRFVCLAMLIMSWHCGTRAQLTNVIEQACEPREGLLDDR